MCKKQNKTQVGTFSNPACCVRMITQDAALNAFPMPGKLRTLDDERRSLRGLLAGADAVLVDGVLNFLQLLQRVEIRGLPLLLQLLAADVRVAGKAPGCLGDLRLDGKLPLQALQLLFLGLAESHTHTHTNISKLGDTR